MRFRIKDLIVSSIPSKGTEDPIADQRTWGGCTDCSGCTNCSWCTACTCTCSGQSMRVTNQGGGFNIQHLDALRAEIRNIVREETQREPKSPETKEELLAVEAQLVDALAEVRERLKNLKE
jgi:hypothetical protein